MFLQSGSFLLHHHLSSGSVLGASLSTIAGAGNDIWLDKSLVINIHFRPFLLWSLSCSLPVYSGFRVDRLCFQELSGALLSVAGTLKSLHGPVPCPGNICTFVGLRFWRTAYSDCCFLKGHASCYMRVFFTCECLCKCAPIAQYEYKTLFTRTRVCTLFQTPSMVW